MSFGGMEVVCPTCDRAFPEGTVHCPYDSAPLEAPVVRDDLLGTSIDNKFTVERRLGNGAMGVVYAARQHSLDRVVALKILPPRLGTDRSGEQRFRTEARAASQLRHPHAVTIHDFGVSERGLFYIAMELLEGESLRARLQRGRLSLRDAVSVGAQMADALAEAHHREPQIIHRDVKPDNVMIRVTRDGELFATVVDFGLALLASDTRVTATNVVVGTVAYMAPERATSGGATNDRVDVYALGATLFEMLVGVPPFNSPDPLALMLKQLNDPPPSVRAIVPGVPPELEALVFDMLAKDPARRPSASEARARLLPIMDALPRSTPTVAREVVPSRVTPRPAPTSALPQATIGVSGPRALAPGVPAEGAAIETPSSEQAVYDRFRPRPARTAAAVIVLVLAGGAVAWGYLSGRRSLPALSDLEALVRSPTSGGAAEPGTPPSEPPPADLESLHPTPIANAPRLSVTPAAAPAPSLADHRGASPEAPAPTASSDHTTERRKTRRSSEEVTDVRAALRKLEPEQPQVDPEAVEDDILNELNRKRPP